MFLAADDGYGLLDVLLVMVYFFFLFMFIWLFISLLADLFRDHETSGWAKAGWVILLIIFPFLGALIYLIVRGKGMAQRALKHQQDAQAAMDDYVRQTASAGGSASSVDEIAKLHDLKEKGAITEDEFAQAKAKYLT